jgi:hypothetical protein
MSVDEAVAVLKSHRLLNNVRRLDDPNYAFPVGAYSNNLFPGKQLLIYVEPGPGDQKPIMATGVELVLIEPDEDAMSHIDQPIVPLGTFIDFAGEPEATSLFPSHRFTIYFQQQSLQADIVSPLGAILPLENGRYKPNIDDMVFGIAVHKLPGFISFRGDKWCGFTSRYCGYIEKRQNVTP